MIKQKPLLPPFKASIPNLLSPKMFLRVRRTRQALYFPTAIKRRIHNCGHQQIRIQLILKAILTIRNLQHLYMRIVFAIRGLQHLTEMLK